MDISGKRVFVTGAGAGIGYETALAFARAGGQVMATDVDAAGLAALTEVAAKEGLSIRAERLDVTDRAAYAALAERLADAGATPEIVINNAGVAFIGGFFDTPPEAWERIIRINVIGVVNGCQLFGPAMVKARKGVIVNIASAASAGPPPNLSAYAASKFAVEGLSDVLAMEMIGKGVHVISVHPGVIDTAIVRDERGISPTISEAQITALQHHYRTKGCHPRVVAEGILDGVRKDRDKVFVGPVAQMSAWLRRFAPTRLKRTLTVQNAREIGYLPAKPAG